MSRAAVQVVFAFLLAGLLSMVGSAERTCAAPRGGEPAVRVFPGGKIVGNSIQVAPGYEVVLITDSTGIVRRKGTGQGVSIVCGCSKKGICKIEDAKKGTVEVLDYVNLKCVPAGKKPCQGDCETSVTTRPVRVPPNL